MMQIKDCKVTYIKIISSQHTCISNYFTAEYMDNIKPKFFSLSCAVHFPYYRGYYRGVLHDTY